jgi:hypothetical protein
MAGCCECGIEPMSSINGGEYLVQLRDCYFLGKNSASWSEVLKKHGSGI